jgi:hypothetical protein
MRTFKDIAIYLLPGELHFTQPKFPQGIECHGLHTKQANSVISISLMNGELLGE